MALSHATAVRTAIAQAVADYAAAGAKLIIYDSGNVVLATVVLTLAAAVAGVTTVDPASVAIAATGTADHAKLYKADGTTLVLDGLTVTATGGGGMVTFATVSFVAAANVDMSAFSYTAPT